MRLIAVVLFADDLVICVAGHAVHDGVQQGEQDKAQCGHPDEKSEVIEVEHEQYLVYKREGEAEVQPRKKEREEEHREKLRVYDLSYLLLRHADALHDLVAASVLIALADLLVVDDKHRRKREHEAEHYS